MNPSLYATHFSFLVILVAESQSIWCFVCKWCPAMWLLTSPFLVARLCSVSRLLRGRGTSQTIARILQPYNIRVAHKLITTLRRLLTNVKDKDKPEDSQGAVYNIKCCDCQASLIHWWNRNKPKHATDRTQTSDEEWWRQQSHCWAPFTDETSNWLGLCDMYNVFYRLLSTSYFRKLVY